jgi:heavy metal sensor kinase
MRWSIRWRLTLWNLLAVALVLFVFAALVYGLVSHALYEKTDQDLLAGARLLEQDQRLTSEGAPRLKYLIEELQDHQNLACIGFSPGGAVLARTQVLASDSIPSCPPASSGRLFRDVTLPIIGRQRELATNVRVGSDDVAVVILASLKEVDHQLGHLVTALSTGIPAALLFAGGVGYVMARRALAPVDRLRVLTEQFTAERLDRRLPVPNQHDELGRLAQTINAMISRLEQSFTEMRRFSADASHELRTPLTVLRTEVEVAMSRPLAPAEVQHLLGSVLEECERLTRLTDQLLTLARQDAGRAARPEQRVALPALLADVVETLRPLAEERAVNFRSEVSDGDVQGDSAALRQVFVNLIDNAIKYTPGGGTVTISVRRENTSVVVTIVDTGEGIAAEHLPRVFDRFYRVDKARTRAAGGTGLGLSIARGIVEAHGGQIELESTPCRGTNATVTLPVEA